MTRALLVAAASLCLVAGANTVNAQEAPADAPPPAATAAPVIPATEPAPAPVAAKPTPPAITLVARIDLTGQRLTVLEHGKPKYSWAISSGAEGFDTPVGTFQPEWMAKMWYSKKYDNAPMPHAVFFKNGAAVHATQATGSLGRPASHGCVRLAPANAAIFYSLVSRHGLVHTRIAVSGKPKYAPSDAIASRRNTAPAYQRVAYAQPMYGNGYGSVFYSAQPAPVMYRPVRYAPQPMQYRVR